MSDRPTPGNLRPGGRTARVRAAVLDAFVDELVEHGYSEVTFEHLAIRSGVHKTTLYRRWGSRDALLLDAARRLAEHAVPVPDTGALQSDLQALADEVVATVTSSTGQALLRAVVAEATVRPEVATTLQTFWQERYSVMGTVVERAIDRNELPADTSPRAVIETLVSPLYFRTLITLDPIDAGFLDAHCEHVAESARSGQLLSPQRAPRTPSSHPTT